jgi:hypothetical protein
VPVQQAVDGRVMARPGLLEQGACVGRFGRRSIHQGIPAITCERAAPSDGLEPPGIYDDLVPIGPR